MFTDTMPCGAVVARKTDAEIIKALTEHYHQCEECVNILIVRAVRNMAYDLDINLRKMAKREADNAR